MNKGWSALLAKQQYAVLKSRLEVYSSLVSQQIAYLVLEAWINEKDSSDHGRVRLGSRTAVLSPC